MKLTQKIAVGLLRSKFRVLSTFSPRVAAQQAFSLFCTPQSRDIKQLPLLFQQAERLEFLFEKNSIVGYRWNKGGIKRTLIVHGFESTAINFEMYVKPLITKGYEVLIFDAPAHGQSSGNQINALVYSNFIKATVVKYGPITSFIAHSFGGLALSLAMENITHDEGTRIVLIAPATESLTAAEQFFRILKIDSNRVKNEFQNIITDIGGHDLSWFSVARVLSSIRATILWIHDEDDLITPLSDVLKIDMKQYPNVKLVITKGLGHRRIYKDGEVGRTIVNFL
jgi:pimeloyl-ACP methyl ester carboxylesterase